MDAVTTGRPDLESEIDVAIADTAWRERLERRVLAPLTHNSTAYYAWIALLLVVIAWALFAFVRQTREGLIVTGMRDRISWGLYISSFVFFIGISYGGTLLSAILRMTHSRWQTPVVRLAEFSTVAALMVGALFPLIDLGRPDRILNMVTFGRWESPLVWDLFAIVTYLTGSALYLLVPLIPDFAICRDRLGATAPRWKCWLFAAMACGWTGTPRQQRLLERAIRTMMILIVPVAVMAHTVIAWIFAMTLRVPFDSTVFGTFFVAGAIFSGIATVILLAAVFRRVLHLEEFMTPKPFIYLGYLLAVMALVMLYLNLSEYVTAGYKLEAGAGFHIRQLMLGPFAGLFWLYVGAGLVLPAVLILIPRTRNIRGIVAAAALVVVAMWVERYLIVVTGFRVPQMAYAAPEYLPTWTEWSILAGGFALLGLILSVFAKLFPVVSIWEVVAARRLAAMATVDAAPAPADAIVGPYA